MTSGIGSASGRETAPGGSESWRRLGASGLWVSPICLGTMTFGDATDARAAARMIAMARAAGVNFIDTADVNAGGRSEEIVGRCTRRRRGDWVLGTKGGNPMGPGANQRGMGRKWLVEAVEGSLRRLGTDYIDVYYLDIDDRYLPGGGDGTPLAETIHALGALIAKGCIRYWGFSNFPAWRIAEMVFLSDRLGVPPPVAGQPPYNAVTRTAESDYLPACAHFGIGAVAYSPLARGVLTGQYRPGAAPVRGSRAARGDRRLLETEYRVESLRVAERIAARARSLGMTAAQFALRWVLNNRLVTSATVGPRTARQWAECLAAPGHAFTAEDEAFVDALVRPGHGSTAGYTDPRYPVMGRRVRT